MTLGREILVPVTRGLLNSVAGRLCREELLVEAGITERDLVSADSWIPLESHARLGAAIATRLPGENLGLQTGTRIYEDPRGALGYVLRRSGTLETALANFTAYLALVNRAIVAELRLTETEGLFVVRMQPELAALGHPAEALFSAWVAISRRLTASAWHPARVEFEHEPKGRVQEHEAFFRCPVAFGQACSCLCLPAASLALKIEPTSHEIDAALDQALEAVGKGLANPAYRPALDELIAHLRSPRPFAGTYRSIGTASSSLSLDVARALLERTRLCAYEVALLVGFQDLSSFEQAYLGRFGCRPTPSA